MTMMLCGQIVRISGAISRMRPSEIFLLSRTCHEREFALCRGVHEDGSDDERTKVVALAGFVDSDAFNGVWRHPVTDV